MEDRSSLIPSFARGLSILLVDHDTPSLLSLSTMLEQNTYRVTTTELASIAISMIEEQKDRFKLIMANANMLDMDCLDFLQILLDKSIPVIFMMSSETSSSTARKAVAGGASFILYKPISIDDLRYVWQHAYRNQGNSPDDQTQNGPCQEEENHGDGNLLQGLVIKETNDHRHENAGKEVEGNGKGKGTLIEENCTKELEINTGKTETESSEEAQRDKREDNSTILEEENTKGKSSSDRKPRILWTPELHLKFTAAISALGDKKARPKPILEMMNAPRLTQRQVASHLQKYKSQVRRICETGTTNLPAVCGSSSFYGRTRISDAPATVQQATPSSDFGIKDMVRLSKSFYGGGTPNITSSYGLPNKNQVPGTSSGGRLQELLDSLPGKFTSGPGNNASAPSASKLPTIYENPKLDSMEFFNLTSGDKSCAGKYPKDFINMEQAMNSMEVSHGTSVNVAPLVNKIPTDFFNDLNGELGVMTPMEPNDQELANLDKILTGSNDLIQELDTLQVTGPTSRNILSNATAVSAPPFNQSLQPTSRNLSNAAAVSAPPFNRSLQPTSRNLSNAAALSAAPPNQISQPQSVYADLWSLLEKEEDDDGLKNLAGEANEEDIDRYCQWLADVMLGKD